MAPPKLSVSKLRVSSLHMKVLPLYLTSVCKHLKSWEHLLCSNPKSQHTRKIPETAPASHSGPISFQRGPDVGNRMVGLTETKQERKSFVFITQTIE